MDRHIYNSLFEIIGPVMVGPSSSHTAGAVRIGLMAKSIFNSNIESVNVFLYESFAETYRGHATDVAITAGLLGFLPDDERVHHSLSIAHEQGITINFIPVSEKVEHPNTAKIVIKNKEKEMRITGVSVGGGDAIITNINDDKLEIRYGIDTIVINHKDVPGVIAEVSAYLADIDVNIATMKVWRQERGQDAAMIIEIDKVDSEHSLHKIYNMENIIGGFLIRSEYHEEH